MKIVWDAIRTMYTWAFVRKAKANTLRHEFYALKFRDGESVDDFVIHIKTGLLCVCCSATTTPRNLRPILMRMSKSSTDFTVAKLKRIKNSWSMHVRFHLANAHSLDRVPSDLPHHLARDDVHHLCWHRLGDGLECHPVLDVVFGVHIYRDP